MTTSPSGNPLGAWVEPSAAATAELPKQILATLPGRLVNLVPGHASHVDELFTVLGGEENASIWDYISVGPFQSRGELHAFFARHWQNPDVAFFTIINNSTQKADGFTALTNINREHRTVEIGYVVFSKELQRKVAATEVMYLLACHVFDNLGFRRCEGRCHSLNGPSYRSALRWGFKVEGVFRQHKVVRGRNRDTTWFSILDGEWPTVKKGSERWLDEGNFDSDGRQRKSLAEMRDAVCLIDQSPNACPRRQLLKI